DRGGCVIDARGVAGRNGAVLLEGRPELRKRLQRGVASEVLINRELDSPLARLDLDWYDLLVEEPRLNRHLRAAMGLERELVLSLTRDPVRLGHVLSRHAHMNLIERVSEAPDHRIDERRVADPRAPAGVLHPVGAPAHRLGTTSEHDLGIAGLNCLGGRDDRLDTAATQAVDGKGRRLLGDPGADADDPGHVHVLGGGVDDVAKHHLVDLVGLNARALDRHARDGGPELGWRDVPQAASEGADRGPGRRSDHNASHMLPFAMGPMAAPWALLMSAAVDTPAVDQGPDQLGGGPHPLILESCPAHSRSRSSNFGTFPVEVVGISSRKATALGAL